jgi:RimJ/RimL family protein N-acetyltransferase
MTAALPLTRITLRPITPDMAKDVANNNRAANWAEDYPTDGDIIISGVLLKAIDMGVDYAPPTVVQPWSGPWQICVRDDKDSSADTVVGAIGFKGGPDDANQVEIGYGITESARGFGYATEAVTALVELASRQGVTVIAETETHNDASERVLQRCGFILTHTALDGNRWWRLD